MTNELLQPRPSEVSRSANQAVPRVKGARILMTTSAAWLIGVGAALTFLPQETAARIGLSTASQGTLLFELIGALCLGMGMANWMSRRSLIGGIYGRPLGVGNLMQFWVGAFALERAAAAGIAPLVTWPLFGGYLLFALSFGWIVLRGKLSARTSNSS